MKPYYELGTYITDVIADVFFNIHSMLASWDGLHALIFFENVITDGYGFNNLFDNHDKSLENLIV